MVRPSSTQSPKLLVTYFSCQLPVLHLSYSAPVFRHLAKAKAILALSELGLAHLEEGTTGGRGRRE